MLLVGLITVHAHSLAQSLGQPFCTAGMDSSRVEGHGLSIYRGSTHSGTALPHLLIDSIVKGRPVCKAEIADRHQSSRSGASAEARRVRVSLFIIWLVLTLVMMASWGCYESTVLLEYLEDLGIEPSLLPRDPKDRAVARLWADHVLKPESSAEIYLASC